MWSRAAALVGGAAAAVVVLYLVAFAVVGTEVPRGATVLDVRIGGMTRAAANAAVTEEVARRARLPVRVVAADRVTALDARAAGLGVDVPGTVAAASEPTFNPLRLIAALFGARQVTAPRIVVDDEALAGALTELSQGVDSDLREGGIVFRRGQPVVIEPRPGRRLDPLGAKAAVEAGFLTAADHPVRLPVQLTEPKVTMAEIERAWGFARRAVSRPVTVGLSWTDTGSGEMLSGGLKVSIPARVIAEHVRLDPDDAGVLKPRVDAVGLKKDLEGKFAHIERPAREASFRFADGKPRVVNSRSGRAVIPKDLADALLGVLNRTTQRVTEVKLAISEPRLTTLQARKLGIVEKTGTFTTNYPYAAYRLQNIHRAADKIRGSVILPGETWSMNDRVGERTAANGFARGTIIKNGRFFKDFGGGTSQVATTTFNAAFFAGLKIVEHRPHSLYISRYPEGREATVAWGATDLRINNDSGHGVYIDTAYTSHSVIVTMWGARARKVDVITGPRTRITQPHTVFDPTPTCQEQKPGPGFDVNVTRIIKNLTGREVRRETFHTRYKPADHVICGPARPVPKGSPPPRLGLPSQPGTTPTGLPPASPEE